MQSRLLSTMSDYTKEIDYELLGSLICGKCFEYYIPPVRMCVCGDIICQGCIKKKVVNSCTRNCIVRKHNIPNFALDRILRNAMFPCKYRRYGCMEVLNDNNRNIHSSVCLYEMRQCPFVKFLQSDCHWKGTLSDIKAHVLEEHGIETDTRQDEGPFDVCFNYFEESKYFCSPVLKFQELFFIIWKIEDKVFSCKIFLIGFSEKALNFNFRFTMSRERLTISTTAAVVSFLEEECYLQTGIALLEDTIVEYSNEDPLECQMEIFKNEVPPNGHNQRTDSLNLPRLVPRSFFVKK
ncbi:hypothetical protein C0J52_20418 [Blattella germanica]|nr:hypothetical protein C0J52_20418 [Blattella germanica]